MTSMRLRTSWRAWGLERYKVTTAATLSPFADGFPMTVAVVWNDWGEGGLRV